MRTSTKAKVIGMVVVAVVCLTQTPVLAATYQYKDYSLGRFSANNYTSAHTKETNDNFIENRVTGMKKATTVTFWACRANQSQISDDYKQKVGSKVDILFFRGKELNEGQQVIMGMENSEWSSEYAFVSGEVDFR
jgi:hypothetical protein